MSKVVVTLSWDLSPKTMDKILLIMFSLIENTVMYGLNHPQPYCVLCATNTLFTILLMQT